MIKKALKKFLGLKSVDPAYPMPIIMSYMYLSLEQNSRLWIFSFIYQAI